MSDFNFKIDKVHKESNQVQANIVNTEHSLRIVLDNVHRLEKIVNNFDSETEKKMVNFIDVVKKN